MNEDEYVVLVLHQGILGIGVKTQDGMEVTSSAEGVEMFDSLEPDEYVIVGLLDRSITD